MKLSYRSAPEEITITPAKEEAGLLGRLFRKEDGKRDFGSLPEDEQDLMFALADLRSYEDEVPGSVEVGTEEIRVSHDAAASLSAKSAQALGLPSDVHLTLRTDATGTLGNEDFNLQYEWLAYGQKQSPRREGSLLFTADGPRRIPIWMKRALDLADGFSASEALQDHWATLASFRKTLEPGEDIPGESGDVRAATKVAMTSFLKGLKIRLADRFSISPDRDLSHFDVIPYSGERLSDDGISDDDVSEVNAEVADEDLAAFQFKLEARGACPAYQLGSNSYLVIDRAAEPVLREMARVLKAPREERQEFIRNPRSFITRAVTRDLQADDSFEQMVPAAQEEMVEAIAGQAFVESREYSERVTGISIWVPPAQAMEGSGTTWLPEVFPDAIADAMRDMSISELRAIKTKLEKGVKDKAEEIEIAGHQLSPTPQQLSAVEALIEQKQTDETSQETPTDQSQVREESRPFVLDTKDNFEELTWHAKLSPRATEQSSSLPTAIRTKLKPHQLDSFRWQIDAWKAGLPGVLNADEQGLGKTLQTLAFLNWLQNHTKDPEAKRRGPILVVAPTSLLVNWEEEVERHIEPGAFGHLVRLYGASISASKGASSSGKDIDSGTPQLDLGWLEEALHEGRAHRYWILTTYTTLANYQHSLGTIPFAAMVCDEIQAIKNMATIRSKAVEAMNADFRIGLTGTPIENTTFDLWTIMDRLAPGALGVGTEFKEKYGVPSAANMDELYDRVFRPTEGAPPLGLRRTKDEVAKDLPNKTRRIHPRPMPELQANEYDKARAKLSSGGRGAALKMLHHIRSVSVHPGFELDSHSDFVHASGRLAATVDILDRIHDAGERALVFIEHRDMQYRFAEIVRQRYQLRDVSIINGSTPIPKRQKMVNKFQENLGRDDNFDILILGPKAAGTGLTLTAATHVIHLSRWWNPAVEEQCNDRVHRIGQDRPVSIHIPMSIHPGFLEGSFDCLLHSLMQRKRRLAERALWPMGDTAADVEGLQQMLKDSHTGNNSDPVRVAVERMFARDGIPLPEREADGSYIVS